jgi:uncharacterized protein
LNTYRPRQARVAALRPAIAAVLRAVVASASRATFSASSRAVLAGALLTVALAACHSAPTRIYTLYPVNPSRAVVAYQGPPVRIDAVHIPPALDRIEVTTTVSPGELKINDNDHWSAPLLQVARQTLSMDLASRLPPGSVLAPRLAKPDGALGVSVDMLDFSSADGTARLSASWTLTPDSHGASPQRVVVLTTRDSVASASSTARTLSDLLAQLADHLADDLSAQYSR